MRTSKTNILKGACWAMLATLALPVAEGNAQEFTYNPPGTLVPGSGTGREDYTVYVPDMRYPIETAPSFPNSQVWGRGGSQGGGGGQCDAQNYSYPWWDNFCETRSWDVPMCPGGKGHQGQDIRPATCEKNVHWGVAAEDGEITQIGTYSVYLEGTASGTRHRYLHMEPSTLVVSVGDRVTKGQRLGKISNAFGGTPTTIHLHYDLYQNASPMGPSYVPTYMSLVTSYERLLGIPQEPCAVVPAAGGVVDDGGPCFRLKGNVASWRTEEGPGEGGGLRWTYAWEDADEDAWAEWLLDLEEAGEYKVEVHVVAEYGKSTRARYELTHAGQTEELRLDMTAGAGWRELGTFNFAAGGEQSLAIFDNTGDPLADRVQIVADAVRLTPKSNTPPPEDMGQPPTQDMGTPPVDMGSTDPGMDPVPGVTPDMGQPPLGNNTTPAADMNGGSGGDGGSASTSSCACRTVSSNGEGAPGGLLALVGLLGLSLFRRRRDNDAA